MKKIFLFVCLALVIAVILFFSIPVPIVSHPDSSKIVFPAIVAMMVLQSMVASIASFVFPAGLVGAKLTHRLYKGKSYVVFLLISSILPAIYFTAIMSISGLLRMMGYHENFWKIYVSSFPRNVCLDMFQAFFGM